VVIVLLHTFDLSTLSLEQSRSNAQMAPSTRKGKGFGADGAAEARVEGRQGRERKVRVGVEFTGGRELTHCGHSFDSRCLAQHFVVKRSCPTCHREAFHDHTVRNQDRTWRYSPVNFPCATAELLHVKLLTSLRANSRRLRKPVIHAD
jgi:hypothetical protein